MTCKHPVKFADGSVFPGQDNPPELKVDKVLSEEFPDKVAGMPLRVPSLSLSEKTLKELGDLIDLGLPVLISAFLRDAIVAHRENSGVPSEWMKPLFVMGQISSPRGEGKSEQICSWLEPVFGHVSR